MHKIPVGLVGASGYAGMEATRILAAHPELELRFATSDRWVGETVSHRTGVMGRTGDLRYVAPDEAETLASGCKAVLLATPAEVSVALAPRLVAAGVKVVDLSGAFRLQDPAAYGAWYGFDHPAPALLPTAVYGLTEVFRARIREASLIANPGCYPTAATLPLAPLLRQGLIDPQMIIINAASGVTGAGRKATEAYGFCEIDGDFRAYRVLRHQHTPEISQTLEGVAGTAVPVTFTPHLLPIKRGILCTTFAALRPGATAKAVADALKDVYADEPFVSVASSADDVSLKQVVGTNRCHLGVSSEGSRLVIVSAIDNLVKGAAGQAVQNLNVLFGLDETAGLSSMRGFHP